MANVIRFLRNPCNRGCPEFPSFDSTAYPGDPTEPGTIYMSDVYHLARNIGITKVDYNTEKCEILSRACQLIADYLERYLDRDIRKGSFIDRSVKELHRVLQQLRGFLEGYSAAEERSPLLLLKFDNTEAFVHLLYDLGCAFASVYHSVDCSSIRYSSLICGHTVRDLADFVFVGYSNKGLQRANWLDRRLILTNISPKVRVEVKQIKASGIGPVNYFMQKYLGPHLKNFLDFKGFVLPLDLQDLTIQRKIAETRYAQVYEGVWCGQIRVAIKTYIACCHDLCQQEASVHAKLQHPNIVQFIGVAKDQDGNASSAVTELMSSITLQDEMDHRSEEGRPFTSLEAINILLQIARGMSYLHSQGIMHRDLKPSNILICLCENCKCVGDMGTLHVKIADFGDAKMAMATSELGTPKVGTHRWMAPEVHSFNRRNPSPKTYTYQADVYSFGVLCCEIVTGMLPFAGVGTKEYYERIGAGERPKLPPECPKGLARLTESCWVGKASERPDFSHLCEVLRELRQVEILGKIVDPPRSDMPRYMYLEGDLLETLGGCNFGDMDG